MRQLGVSFINPEDLERPATTALQSGPGQLQQEQQVSTLFLPRAACPSASVWNQLTSTATSSPDTSLEISSLALKYLDEAQLSKLAATHHGNNNYMEAATAAVSQQYHQQQQQKDWQRHKKSSSSDVNMSLATQEFLNRYGLATPSPHYDAAAADNSSPKLKGGDNFGGAVHRQRRPLTPLQNNNNNAPPPVVGSAAGAGGRQVLELRRELLKGK